jgi:tripartite-type tricarboxylate transporter receptor subunit TctC
VTACIVAQGISGGPGQSVLVANRTGAAGNLANEHVAHSIPDGYALAMGSMGSTPEKCAAFQTADLPCVAELVRIPGASVE